MEIIKTDVLVIGGGLAGLVAALEAKAKGLEVLLISKSKVGRSGNTLVSNAFIAAQPEVFGDEERQLFIEDILKSGKEINDLQLVELFVDNSFQVIKILEKYGVNLKKTNGIYVRGKAPGHSEARNIFVNTEKVKLMSKGLAITLPLLAKAKEMGIKLMERCSVVKILTKDNQVCGAVALAKKDGRFFTIKTGVVILASGGNGQVFAQTNNTNDVTGDSYSLAYEAGARLRDMEYIQFFPTMMYKPVKLALTSALFGEGAVLRNALGEAFMVNYDPAGNMATRDIMCQAIFNEITAGRGKEGCVFLDCTAISEEILVNKYKEFYDYLKKAGIDLRKEYVPVAPGTHFCMGGIAINEQGETSVKGLWACGEAVGGLHGANRLGGNALAEAIIFGSLVGARVEKVQNVPLLEEIQLQPLQDGDITLDELKKALREIMWKYSSIIRSRDTLLQAQDQVKEIKESLKYVKLSCVGDQIRFYELISLLNNAELITTGAICREESRGAHYRSDFPETDIKFKGNFYLQKVNGKVKVEFEKC